MIDLYGMSSPNVLKIVLMLEELGLPYRLHHVAVHRSEQFDPGFLAMNPLAKVPVLVDDRLGEPIFESGAILIYLAETEGLLLPAGGPARSAVLKWLMAQVANVGPLLGQLNHFNMMPADENQYALSRYRDQAARIYGVLDARLAASPWLGGADYSIADIATWPWASYVDRHGFSWDRWPALKTWLDLIAARPAAKRATEATGQFRSADMAARAAATPEHFDRFFWRSTPGPPPVTPPAAVR